MKIVYWTPTSGGGTGKYEKYLPEVLKKAYRNIETEVILRRRGFIWGNPIIYCFRYRAYNADIVHATTPAPVFLSPTSYFKKIKNLVVTIHVFRSSRPYSKSILPVLNRLFTPIAIKKADKIIAVSEFTKKEILDNMEVDKRKIKVISLGVDRSLYHPMDKEKCKKKFGLNPDEKYILVVSNTAKHKRMDIMKKVFQKVREERSDVKLLKAGYGTKLSGVYIINIDFIPESDMPYLYNAADVLLHTSEYEGILTPGLEAMACGTPIVASNIPAIRETVGDCGELVDLDAEDCVERFAEKVLACIDGGKDWKAIERSKEFSWQKTAKETLKVYEELL